MKYLLHLIVFGVLTTWMTSCSPSTSSVMVKDEKIVKDKFEFNTLLKWKYSIQNIKNRTTETGEISIYVDERTGTFLLDRSAYGSSGEMIDFVIADQKGNYIVANKDELGNKRKFVVKSKELNNTVNNRTENAKNINFLTQPSGRKETYPHIGNQTNITGVEYYVTDPITGNVKTVMLAKVAYGFLPITLFNGLGLDSQLPYPFDNRDIISNNYILLREHKETLDYKMEISLISSTTTVHKLNIHEYKA